MRVLIGNVSSIEDAILALSMQSVRMGILYARVAMLELMINAKKIRN
jgi:hypothetical protein